MHPPYTEEKRRAAALARAAVPGRASILAVSTQLRSEFPDLEMYVADTIARYAVVDAEELERLKRQYQDLMRQGRHEAAQVVLARRDKLLLSMPATARQVRDA